ncbi:hypothetical protein QYE76_066968 [Lolium multiflorum]|uniref:Retrotransposon gag domain-containing protein n=1 Tax=Lolium multiflorum TaxID=4521 RepID=A0AAD8SCM8_LOLMU|nr:hypothetical protein QYE76_066968 [Lolium multiflorum]
MTIPRHLAPTVGPSASAAGVFIRTGLTTTTGERVASGLVWRFGSLDSTTLAASPTGHSLPAATSSASAASTSTSPPSHHRATRARSCAVQASLTTAGPRIMQEVMTTDDDAGAKSARVRGPVLEREAAAGASASGAKAPPPPSRLDEVWAKLSSPLTAGADPSAIEKDLETHRTLLLMQAEELSATKRQMEITQREYNRAHGFTPAGDNPSRAGHIRRRGGGLGAEIARDGAESPAPSMEPPVYNTPDKNMRAAQAAAEELSRLQGEELRRQTKRVTELLNAATKQSADPRYAHAPRASHARGAAGNDGDGPRDTAESASPAPSRHRDSRNTHASSSRTSRPPGGNSGRSRPPSSRRDEEEYERPSTIKHRAAPEASGQRQPAHSRLGPRIEPTDARDRLDRLVESRIAEEEGPAGPKCFGPRILNEPMIDGFQLPRTPKQQALGRALLPLMLLGSARTWLNNLPAGSINGWLDFEDAFISNFTGTYRRPGRPQELEMCKQGPNETDRAYLTRWCEMRNSCEGVHEIQAVGFFMAGCRPNTMLWHKLRRSDPKTMAALMAIADKYALAEEASNTPAEISPAPSRRDNNKPAEHKPAEGGHHGSRRDNYRGKRHSDQPDRRYGSAHVAAVSDHAAAGGSRRQKQTDRPWKPKYTFEQMLDSPCKYHSGKNPSNHSTRDCHFMKRLTSGEPLPPPPPPPPAGGPGGQAGAEANNLEHHEANQVHHGGRYLAEDATYIILLSPEFDQARGGPRSGWT